MSCIELPKTLFMIKKIFSQVQQHPLAISFQRKIHTDDSISLYDRDYGREGRCNLKKRLDTGLPILECIWIS